jgi:uncharacterized protein
VTSEKHGKDGGLMALPVRRPIATLVAAGIIVLLSLLSALRLEPNVSLTAMLAEDDPAAESLRRIVDHFPAMDELLLVARLPDGDTLSPQDGRARLRAFAARFAERAKATRERREMIARVTYDVAADSPERAFVREAIAPNMLLYVDEERFEEAMARLTLDAMREQIAQNEAMIAAPGQAAGSLARELLRDPLRMREFITPPEGMSPSAAPGEDSGFFSGDGRALLVRIAGAEPASHLDFTSRLLEEANRIAAEANDDALLIEFAGAYAIAEKSHRAIRSDMIRSVTGSVVLILFLLIFVYRRAVSILLAFLPVAAAIVTAFGIFALFRAELTPITAVIGAVLAGLGIDYCVHMLSHYESRRKRGIEPFEAAVGAIRSVAPRTAAAAATTLIGFLAISQSHVAALRDFSILGGLGLAASLAASLTVLPAMLIATDRRAADAAPVSRMDAAIGALTNSMRDHRRIWVGSTALLLALAVVVLLARPNDALLVDSNLASMHPQPNPALDLQNRIPHEFAGGTDSMLLHLSATSTDALIELAHAADRRLRDPAVRELGVTGTFSIATLLPRPSEVATRTTRLNEIDPEQVVQDFQTVIDESIFDPAVYADYVEFLRGLVRPSSPDISDVRAYPGLADALLPSSVDAETATTESIAIVRLSHPPASREERDTIIITLRAALHDLNGVTLTGLNVVGYDTEAIIRRDLVRLLLIASVAVIVFLLVIFRQPTDVLLTLIPTAFGLVVLLGLMHAAGQGFNLANLIALPLLCGIGVDDGIFMTTIARRHRDASPTELSRRLRASTHAVIVTSATTMLAFGSLAFTSVPAIQSLGWMSAAGVGACLLGTFGLLVPLLLARQVRRVD